MYLKITHDIENHVFSTKITIDSLGTETLSEDEEREILRDFPSKVTYRNLTFSKNVKLVGSALEVTDDLVSDSVVKVTLPVLSNKEILLDKDFEALYKIDTAKIPQSALDSNVLTTKELVAQAYCVVFDEVVVKDIAAIMEDIRSKAPTFTKETILNV